MIDGLNDTIARAKYLSLADSIYGNSEILVPSGRAEHNTCDVSSPACHVYCRVTRFLCQIEYNMCRRCSCGEGHGRIMGEEKNAYSFLLKDS